MSAGSRPQGHGIPNRAANRPKRIVLLGSYAPSLINFRGPLIEAMVAEGHEVYAAAPGMDETIANELRALGAIPQTLRLENSSLNPAQSLRSVSQIRSLFRRVRPDLVIAYTIKPITLGALAARAEKVPAFVPLVTGLGYAFTPGGEPKRLLSRLMGKFLYRRAFATASLAIFQNSDDRRDFSEMGLLPGALPTLIVNGSGVDISHFSPSPLPTKASFLMIARLLGDKGVREYGEAALRLKREHPHVRVALAGHLFPSPDCIRQTELDAFVAGGLEFLGHLDDVRPALGACRVYVLPSYREGTPRSVLEALAAGRAVITTDAPGCRETVNDGENGILVPPRDADALYRAMLRFIEEPALAVRMGAESRRLATEKFDVRAVNDAILRRLDLI